MPQWPWKKARPGVDLYGRSPLWYHAAEGDLKAAAKAIRDGADPTAADKDSYGALHVAVQNGHAKMVELLLSHGADPNVVDRHGNGPLWTAGYYAGRDATGPDGLASVAALLRAGADPHHLNGVGKPPLAWANYSAELRAAYDAAGFTAVIPDA